MYFSFVNEGCHPQGNKAKVLLEALGSSHLSQSRSSICSSVAMASSTAFLSSPVAAPKSSRSSPSLSTPFASPFPRSLRIQTRASPSNLRPLTVAVSVQAGQQEAVKSVSASPPPSLPFRVGHGFDLHRLEPNLPLIIGGIDIPHDRGCEAHSDGKSDED